MKYQLEYRLEFRPGCTPVQAVAYLKDALAAVDKAQHCAVLWFAEIRHRRLYRGMGYSSMNQFAEVELGFSRTKTGDFLRLCCKLDELPTLRASVASGKVGYSKAREVIKVATPDTEKKWVEQAEEKSRVQLRQDIQQVQARARQQKSRPAAGQLEWGPASSTTSQQYETPVRICLEFSPEQYARLEALEEALRKQGRSTSGKDRAACFLDGLAGLANIPVEDETGVSPNNQMEPPVPTQATAPSATQATAPSAAKASARRRALSHSPVHIHLFQCPDCQRATIQTNRGELPIRASTFERLVCDARIHQAGKPNKATIPPSTRALVLSRDRHHCQAPGCRHTRHLEVHHITPRSKGGNNHKENLITLCRGCHQVWHEQGGPPSRWLKAAAG